MDKMKLTKPNSLGKNEEAVNTEFYHALIQKSPIGFANFIIKYGKNKEIIALEFDEVNESFEHLIGLKKSEIIKKSVTKVFPEMKELRNNWIPTIQDINIHRTTSEFTHFFDITKLWIHMKIYSVKKNTISVMFNDVSREIKQLVQLENFFEVNLDLLCIADMKGKFIKVNKEWEFILGFSTEELESRTFIEFVHPEDIETTYQAMDRLAQQIEVFNFINRFRCKDGSYRYIEWRSHPQGDLIYGAARDITERIRLEEKLQEKNTLIESILNNAPVGIWLTYPENSGAFTNKYVDQNFNMTEEEKVLCQMTDKDALSKEETQSFEETVTYVDGKKHILETVKTKVLREDGTILGTLGIGIDVTKRKENEEALRVSEMKYRLLTETTSDVIWVWNLKRNRLVYVSPSVLRLRGYTVDESLNQSMTEIIAKTSFENIKGDLKKALYEFLQTPETDHNILIEAQLTCKDGGKVWTEISARMRFNSSHEIEIIGSSRNMEQRKKIESEVMYLSYHDQLTGLYNRRYYEEGLKRINVEDNYPITLMMADVNGLKLTNDAFGHILGDKLLITFADILKKECRSEDIIARIGGDEFVLLLPRTNSKQAEKIFERINATVNKSMIEKVMLSVSFGWKTKTQPQEEFDDIYKQAEDAMYRRKLLDGNSYKSDTIKLITKSLYEKSPKEQIHSERVSMLCKNIGIALGMSSDDVNELGVIGLLHDIGKIGIDEHILNKPGRLTDEELQTMRRHPEIGYHILRAVNEFVDIAEYVLAHHERLDGKGYPKGLTAEEIPLKSKILFIAEAFDEMTGSYRYKEPLTIPEAVQELKRNSGIQFDTEIVRIFVEKILKESY